MTPCCVENFFCASLISPLVMRNLNAGNFVYGIVFFQMLVLGDALEPDGKKCEEI